MTPDELQAHLEAHGWRFAKSMPHIPHEYSVRLYHWKGEDELFVECVRAIREHGIQERWGRYHHFYFHAGDWRYWTMGNDLPDDEHPDGGLDNAAIINREKIGASNHRESGP